jgi:hypothetical protein
MQIHASTSEQREMAAWAQGRFKEAGLTLPSIAVEFVGPSLEPCGGAQARTHLDRRPITISVCWGDQFVLLHEFAHAWTYGALTESQRLAFIDLRTDVRAWADPADPWKNRGHEHAANVIAWGLMETPRVVGRTYPNDRASLTRGFNLLTGTDPLHTTGGDVVAVNRAEFQSSGGARLESGA